MQILAIDTSSEQGGVALLADARVLAAECGEMAERSASGLFRRVASVLARAGARLSEVDCFAVASGPGSFTGLRVGLTAVKGWAEVWQRPVAAVSVLQAVAAQSTEPGSRVAALLDARRGQFFCGLYGRTRANRNGLAGRVAVEAGAGDTGLQELEQVDDEVVGSPVEILDRLLAGSAETPLLATPSPMVAATIVSSLAGRSVRIEMVSNALAPVIGRLGWRQALRGEVVDALGLTANYIQRCGAEMNWKDSV